MKKIAKELPSILALGTILGCLILFVVKG